MRFFVAPVGRSNVDLALRTKTVKIGSVAERGERHLVPVKNDSLVAEGTLDLKGLLVKFRAVGGLYAGGFLAAALLVFELGFLEPAKNTQHFMLTIITSLGAGMFLSAAVGAGRLHDAMRRGDEYREDLHRVTDEKRALEQQLYPARLSSIPSPKTTSTRSKK